MKNFALKNCLGLAPALFLFMNLSTAQKGFPSKNNRTPGDIALDSCYIHFQAWLDTAYFDDGFYSNRSISQIMPVAFKGRVYNPGTADQTEVSFTTQIHSLAGNLLYTGSDTVPSLTAGNSQWFTIDNSFTPAGQGRHTVSMFCNQAEGDLFPANNETDTVSFNISQNKSISRYRFYNDNFSPSEYYVEDGHFAGILIYLVNYEEVEGISVFIDTATDPGTILNGHIFQESNSTYVEQISTDDYSIQASDIGSWITIPVYIITAGSEILEGGHKYLVGFDFHDLGANLFIGSDTLGPHDYEIETSFRDTFGNPVNEVLMIGLDMTQPSAIAVEHPGYEAVSIFNMYPNPVTNTLFIETSVSSAKIEEVKIYSILREELEVGNSRNENRISINMEKLPSGIFLLEISMDGNTYCHKIIKD